jgi:signal transduction histidine kinase
MFGPARVRALSSRQSLVLLFGLLVTATGLAVLVAWRTSLPLLITAGSSSGMAPNTAAGFLIAGVAICALVVFPGRPAITASLGMFLAILSGLTLAEFLADTQLGIDNLLVDDVAGLVRTLHPGRMAPATALMLLLLGGALLTTGAGRWGRRSSAIQSALVCLGVVLAGLSLAYTSTGLEPFPFVAGMAPHTFASFAFAGVALLIWLEADRLAHVSVGISGQAIGLVLAVSLPMLTLVVLVLYIGTLDARSQAETRVASVASTLVGETSREVQRIHETLRYLASRPDLTDASRCGAVLEEVKALNKEYAAVIVTSKGGETLCHASTTAPRNMSFADREWFQEAMRTGAFSVGEPIFGRTSLQPVVSLALPFRGNDGAIAGLVVVGASLAELNRSLGSALDLPNGSVATVFSRRGTVIGRSMDGDRWIQSAQGEHPLFKEHRGAAVTEMAIGIDGVRRMYAFRTMRDTGWLVAVGVPEKVALEIFTQRLNRTLAIVAFGVGCTLLVAGLLARRMRLAIVSLRAAARQASGGSWKVQAIEDGPTEVVEAARAFNEMIAARAAVEGQLQERTRALEAANRELESFAYSVSHDLRAPLRAVDGFSQVLLEDYSTQLDEEAQRYLNRIREASQKMGSLIDDMLKLSRVTRGELEIEDVDLSALADEIVRDLRAAEPRRDVDVLVPRGLRVQSDKRMLRAVLVNLLSNAWKFTGKSAHPHIELSGRVRPGELELCVKDNGAGFDAAHAAGLFTPFFRAHRTSEFPGTGIGLATVKRAVERLGGRVWAQAAPGEGAIFYFTLPAHDTQARESGPAKDHDEFEVQSHIAG